MNITKDSSNALESLLKTLVYKLNNNEIKSNDLIDQYLAFKNLALNAFAYQDYHISNLK